MIGKQISQAYKADIEFYDFHPAPSDFYSEVIEGLSSDRKHIPPKFFYDEKGSRLFEGICRLPEYYPTRTEQMILEDNADEIARVIGEHHYVIEPGCGSCEKIKLLLETLKPKAYVPIDISRKFLKESARELSREYPWLDVHAACIDFTGHIELPFCKTNARKLAFFPGSSIGNFEPRQARKFLSHILNLVGPGGGLLIGVDLKKDKDILNRAYNDSKGVTSEFNLNLLTRINSELDADFDPDQFEHHAFYNQDDGRIEMHLVSRRNQKIRVGEYLFEFQKGETIHTENSYKYTIEEFQKLGAVSGFLSVHVWTDPENLFSVQYFEAATS